MPQAFEILFGAALTVATGVTLGKLLLRGLGLKFYKGEEEVFSFVVGSACLSTLVFLTTAARLAYEVVFVVVGVATIAVGCRFGVLRASAASLPRLENRPSVCALRFPGDGVHLRLRLPNLWAAIWKGLFIAVFAAFTFAYFFNAMAPETSPDGVGYHLAVVSRYLSAHRFPRITTNIYASLSEGVEMLFLFAFSIGRHSAAALVHFGFLLALALAIVYYGKRFGNPVAGVVGALLVYCAPVVGRDGTCCYNDVATACIVFSLFYLLQIWDQERAPALLVPIGLLAGFAYATKYTAFVAVPYALVFVSWKLWRSQRPIVRPLLVVGLCALAMMAPWMIKNWIVLQNPFSPFLNSVFPNPYVHVSFEEGYARFLRHYSLKSRWEIPWEVTVHGGWLSGILGPLFLLAPLAIFDVSNRTGRQLLLGAAVFGMTYPANISTRFLIPVLPFVALSMAIALVRWRSLAAVLVLGHAVSSWPSVLGTFTNAWRIETIPVHKALRLESEDSYLRKKFPWYVLAKKIDSVVPPGKRILSFDSPANSYISREVLVGYEGAFNSKMLEVLSTAAEQSYWLLNFHFTPPPPRAARGPCGAGC